jgi:ABC-type Na+ transport system ATPase subunit NatA
MLESVALFSFLQQGEIFALLHSNGADKTTA